MHVIIIRRSLIKKIVIGVLVLLFITIALVIAGKTAKDTSIYKQKSIPIYSVKTNEKKIAISFDTSWGYDNTKKILDVLKKQDVKATFFVIGKWIEQNPEDGKLIESQGNEIGNHSDSHKDFTKLSKEEIIKDVESSDAKIMGVTGIKTNLFRFPEGTYDDRSVKIVESTNHKCIQWDVDSIDWRNDGQGIEYKRVMKKAKNGSIILFHNSGRYTPETLDLIITKLKQQGYTFVKISDLIYKNNYIVDENGTQIQK
ncbi:polysaccharide deacetylase family sporulation protein PdaB [Clostridium acidisoli DSM 12555]|jgi:polysaccharide deacetylase family sporulation protein PdaB|uniref:Polysaccharide deacetylase family sporulation protein PdaB n=1 Tax=Clostridium acidisoli DSM 12555 TaxID=1121291 RepID=A0A1W1XAS2_9CLOT|nr:polysaccharide deacetylase family sporulation protein PdaB [Clostridium acidisoli]SMC20798.1 polysaccharide deacetylase family sporulation protein PdaB [Clostridium acidisoli DSM 12555]